MLRKATPLLLSLRPSPTIAVARFATISSKSPNKKPPPKTFQITKSTPSTSPTSSASSTSPSSSIASAIDKSSTPKPTSVTPPTSDVPTFLDEIDLDAYPSSSQTSSNTKSSSGSDKDALKDLKSQLNAVTKEKNSLKQSLNSLQLEHATLLQERTAWQSQITQLSAIEAIYGDAGLGQLKNLVKEMSGEETTILRSSGFDSDAIDVQLETKLKDLAVHFTTQIATEIAKTIAAHLKRLRDLHKQSSSAATATHQTLKNAGVPESVIAGSVASLNSHLEELQSKLTRWEKLKADVDLLLATYQ